MGRLLYGPRAAATDTFEQKARTGIGAPARDAPLTSRCREPAGPRARAGIRPMRLSLATRLILLL
ncbi:hypothetical protein BOC41_08390 [Burkholderia pseudomallei]|nr:hypothetical protein BOC44_05265 [Burkholderia pseudomallei]OSP96439.1 hypothetical protein BOC41_08390 [Burkholderia pseudomallei]